ncbi:MAG: WYL domain-containing protein [Chryseolinea sp.]
MPLSKNALTRYQLINECFTNRRKRYWSIEEIIEKAKSRDIQMARRTLEQDLHDMRDDDRLNYHAPIAYSKKNNGHHYKDADYSIDTLPLSEDEIETFELMVESFKRFKGAEVLNHVEGMFDKLEKVAGQLKQKTSKLNYSPILFERIPYNKGIDHFDMLYQAILKQKPLLIHYKKFDNEKAKEHTFHPYLLKEYKFRWYLLGYNQKSKNKLILALDRIEGVAVVKIPFIPYKGKEPEKYFDNTIGVTIKDSGVKEIHLWFSHAQGNYIKTQQLHETQQIISDTSDGLMVTLQLIINYELLQTLLAFGPEVKVLEPASLKEEIRGMLEKSLELYKD